MYETQLACIVARTQFGLDAERVTSVLLHRPGIAEGKVILHSELSKKRVRKALRLLIQHGAVVCTGDGAVNYHVLLAALLMRIRLTLYESMVDRMYGEAGRIAMHELFIRGRMTAHGLHRQVLGRTPAELGLDSSGVLCMLTEMTQNGILVWCGSRAESPEANVAVGEKRPRTVEGDVELPTVTVGVSEQSRRVVGAPTHNNNNDVWHLGYWALNRLFRNEACRMALAPRLKVHFALEVVVHGLTLALEREDLYEHNDCETRDIPTEDVRRSLLRAHADMGDRDFWPAVQELLALDPPFVVGSQSTLRFVPGRLVATLREQTLEEVVVSRYKVEGRRIFRALLIEGAMEEKALAARVMMDAKAVRDLLFTMMKADLVGVQEVPRSHEAERAKNWYYLWYVRPQLAADAVLRSLYKAQVNLLLKLEALKALPTPDGEEEKKTREMQLNLLEVSCQRIDQSVMVMRDFGDNSTRFIKAHYRTEDLPNTRLVIHDIIK